MTTHIWKKMLSSLLCGILSVSCMTATVFAIDGKSVSGAFGSTGTGGPRLTEQTPGRRP